MIAYQICFAAFTADIGMVVTGKILPVLHLGGTQLPGSMTDRADIPQCGKNGTPYEIGTVLYSLQSLRKGFIHLESDGFGFFMSCTQFPRLR